MWPKIVQTPEEFGAILRSQRRARQLTQAGAAELAGVGTRLWNEAERGKRTQLGMETAMRMLQTLGVDLAIVPRNGLTRRGD